MVANVGSSVYISRYVERTHSWIIGQARVLKREIVTVTDEEGKESDRLLLTVRQGGTRVTNKVWADELGVI